MNIRCYRCGWSFSLSRELMEAAVTDAAASRARNFSAQCPRCRTTLKVAVDQLRRALPPDWTPPTPAPPAPEAPAVEPDVPTPAAEPEPEPEARKPARKRATRK